jgi:ribonuclease P protein component
MSPEKQDQRFPREARLRRQAEFDRVYGQNVYAADATLVVQGCRNGMTRSRLGLSVSRRVGNAVLRNRWKRLIREAFRRHYHQLPQGIDFVVRPRRGAHPSYVAIQRALDRLTRRIERQLKQALR